MTRAVPAVLSISLLLSLCACAPKPSVDPAETISRFQQQNSVSCTIESELALNRSDTDDTENTFTEALDAEGAVNMETRDCHLSGVLTHNFDSGECVLSDVESYGGAFGAYYRLDDSYYASEEETAAEIKRLYEDCGYVIDTHTAVAAARKAEINMAFRGGFDIIANPIAATAANAPSSQERKSPTILRPG